MARKTTRQTLSKSITCYKVLRKVIFAGEAFYFSPDKDNLLFKYPKGKTIFGGFPNTDKELVPKVVLDGVHYGSGEGYLHAFEQKRDAVEYKSAKTFYERLNRSGDSTYVVCKMKIPTLAKYAHHMKVGYGFTLRPLPVVAARRMRLVTELKVK